MTSESMRASQKMVLIAALILAIGMALALSVSLLPPAPTAPTPTWPEGINLPDKLPHLPQ